MTPLERDDTSRAGSTEAAAGWVVRLLDNSSDLSQRAAFQAWLAADTRHRAAFEAARAAYADVDRAWHFKRPRRSPGVMAKAAWSMGAAMAAGLAVVLLAPEVGLASADHRTRTGDVQQLTLDDGSRLWLDTDSAVDVRFADSERSVALLRGRLFVEVAEGDARPFAVLAEGAVIRDIGTAFSVDRRGQGFAVAVSDGIVDISREGQTTRLTAGQAKAFDAEDNRLRAASPADNAWTERRIVLDRIPLREAVARIDLYQPGHLVWKADGGAQPVSGVLDLNRLDEGLDTLAADNGLRLVRLPGVTLVVSGKS